MNGRHILTQTRAVMGQRFINLLVNHGRLDDVNLLVKMVKLLHPYLAGQWGVFLGFGGLSDD